MLLIKNVHTANLFLDCIEKLKAESIITYIIKINR